MCLAERVVAEWYPLAEDPLLWPKEYLSDESGEGEGLTEPEDLRASRRGEKSIRERNLAAMHEVAFPLYPDPEPPHEDFGLPSGFVDREAPVSARQWCAMHAMPFLSTRCAQC